MYGKLSIETVFALRYLDFDRIWTLKLTDLKTKGIVRLDRNGFENVGVKKRNEMEGFISYFCVIFLIFTVALFPAVLITRRLHDSSARSIPGKISRNDIQNMAADPSIDEFCDDYMITLSVDQRQLAYKSQDSIKTLASYLPKGIPGPEEYREKYVQKIIQILGRIGYDSSFVLRFSAMIRESLFPLINEESIGDVLDTQNAGITDDISYFRDTLNYDNVCCRALCGIAIDSADRELAERIGSYMMTKKYVDRKTYNYMLSMV